MSGVTTEPPAHFPFAEADAAVPRDAPTPSLLVHEHGSMRLKLYAPQGVDRQTPHAQDELYIVQRGTGTFVRGEASFAFGPGDALFVRAGVPHRFEGFSDDLAVWVVFYGPEGGEEGG